jgi:hypothetical protein
LFPIAIPSPFPIVSRIRLLLQRTRVIHVVIAVINRRGETMMTTLITENQESTEATAPASEPKATKKGHRRATEAPCCALQGQVGEEGHTDEEGRQSAQESQVGED